jgi:tRNA nucleotidyltransferase (CCA-adding enzyme)
MNNLNNFKIEIPDYVKDIQNCLMSSGHEAFVVGGCVRDSLIGVLPSDWDLTTDARPDEMLQIFSSYRTVTNGIEHGTVAVINSGKIIEITTYRTDGAYSDHRHPENVSFSTNILDDLSRRDFTVNAMAYSDHHGLIDPFGGKDDLYLKLIRCVGDPATRFDEDALRILRAMRFSSVLGFDIEKSTSEAIHSKMDNLKFISAERINAEFSKLITGPNADTVLNNYREVVAVFIPEILPAFSLIQHCEFHDDTVWEHTLKALRNSPPKLNIRLSVFFHDLGKAETETVVDGVSHFYGHSEKSAEIAADVLRRLRYDSHTCDEVCKLVSSHMERSPISDTRIKRLLNKFGETDFFDLMDLLKADSLGLKDKYAHINASMIDDAVKRAGKIISDSKCFSKKSMAINGYDLLSVGYSSGPALGRELDMLFDLIISGKIQNNKSILLDKARKDFHNY